VRWESDGQGAYTIETLEKATRGTEVTLHLREGEDELLDGFRLRGIVRKYSDHISLPILMPTEGESKEGESKEGEEAEEVVNSASALWARSRSEISTEQYNEFYKHVAHDFTDPLAYVHSRMEGTHEYTLLLYIPSQAPFDLWTREYRHGVKLYVRRVFIMEDADKLLPHYLRFVRGIIDSSDLPLNVSRELLQHNRLIDTIRSTATKKVLGLLGDLVKNEPEKYATSWQEFGRVLKEGLLEDHTNHDTLASLLRFSTTTSASEAQEISLETYVSRMKEGQEQIYYITADSYAAAKESPLLEIFKKKGIEVLLLFEPVDHLLTSELREFQGKQLQSVSKAGIDLDKLEDAAEKEEHQKSADEVKDLLQRIKATLGDKVKDVRTTARLITSPACLVVDEYGLDPSLKRLLQSAGQKIPDVKPILEINPQHPIIARLKSESDEQRFTNWANVLFDQSVLSSGEQLNDPINFVNRLNSLLAHL
jgi:molecular chaperone HtpG